MPEGSPARGIAAGLLLAVLSAALIWTLWPARDSAGTVASPPASPPASESASVEPTPSSPPVEPSEPAEQPAGPATGDYAELATAAELEHPDTDPHIRRWYDWFGYFTGDEDIPAGEWTNKQEVWDALTADVRAEALTLGPPFPHPLFDGDTGQPALVNPSFSTADTGLGELIDVGITYRNPDGRVVRRYWPVLVAVDAGGVGRVLTRLDPFELLVTDYNSDGEMLDVAGNRSWAQVMEQR